MRMPNNTEKHPTQKGAWIIYDANGLAFRAYKQKTGGYRATASHADQEEDGRMFWSETLTKLSERIGASARRA